eukprot:3304013-Amphidinium_carterae.1
MLQSCMFRACTTAPSEREAAVNSHTAEHPLAYVLEASLAWSRRLDMNLSRRDSLHAVLLKRMRPLVLQHLFIGCSSYCHN